MKVGEFDGVVVDDADVTFETENGTEENERAMRARSRSKAEI